MNIDDSRFNIILHEEFFELAGLINNIETDAANLINSSVKQNILIDLAVLRDKLLKYRIKLIQTIGER